MFYFDIISTHLDSSNLKNTVKSLLSSELLGLRIPQFYSIDACQEIVECCHKYGFFWMEPEWGRIGQTIAQFHSHPEGKKFYFHSSPKVIQVRQWLFGQYKDPVEKVASILANFCPCQLAFDEEYHQYYSPGVISIQTKGSKLHVDHVKYESYDWSLTDISAQFSCVLYLQVPESRYGGQLEIYNRCWREEDIKFEFSQNPKIRTGVDEKIIESCSKIEFQPQIGDLLIFNTSYYHRILKTEANQLRITSLSFFGINSKNQILFFM
jgi:hypothetical protein